LDIQKVKITHAMARASNAAEWKIHEDPSCWTSHTVVVLDQSGSMRREDATQGNTRADCVWVTLVTDLAQRLKSGERTSTDVFSLVGMREDSTVLIDRAAADWLLHNKLVDLLRTEKPGMGGNYLPSFDEAESLLRSNMSGSCALSLMFLSDGRPSDHQLSWDEGGEVSTVQARICERMAGIAELFGPRLNVAAVSFGRADDDYSVLKAMADEASRFHCDSDFHEGALDVDRLAKAFSSFASSTTETKTMLTEIGGTAQREMKDIIYDPKGTRDDTVITPDKWVRYAVGTQGGPHQQCFRHRWSKERAKKIKGITDAIPFEPIDFVGGARTTYLAKRKCAIGSGRERVAYSFCEVDSSGMRLGPCLVAKDSVWKELDPDFSSIDFHKTFCKTQEQAQLLALIFNEKLALVPGVDDCTPRVKFVECTVYVVPDATHKRGNRGYLVEKRLPNSDTRWQKWNNNKGFVKGGDGAVVAEAIVRANIGEEGDAAGLDVLEEIGEEEEEGSSSDSETEDENEYDDDDDDLAAAVPAAETILFAAGDVPQAFSHFTYNWTKRKMLVCDLQGVLNTECTPPVFELTDPVIHYKRKKQRPRRSSLEEVDDDAYMHPGAELEHAEQEKNEERHRKFGRTDRGGKGCIDFFTSHKCSALCRAIDKTWVKPKKEERRRERRRQQRMQKKERKQKRKAAAAARAAGALLVDKL
jgi:hypothetical protein